MTLPLRERRFLALLIWLVLLLVTHPFLANVPFDAVVSAVLLSSVWSISRQRWRFVVGAVLASPALIFKWAVHFAPDPVWAVIALTSGIAFLTFTVVTILTSVMGADEVTDETIYGAICVYLVLALLFGLVYTFLEVIHPGSFVISSTSTSPSIPLQRVVPPELLYFSIVTLTTVGFGDIRPATNVAQSLAGAEAITGQLYLAVLIARLIGLHATRRAATK